MPDGPPTGDQHGFIKISRKAYKSDPFWNEPRSFSRWEAWEYMIQAASFEDRHWTDGQGVVQLERGETHPLSLRTLAKTWRWTVKKVRVYLDTLKEMDRITDGQETAQGHTYLLVNYGFYQGQGHSEGTAGAQPGHNSKKVKKEKSGAPKRKRKVSLPDDWTPNETHQGIAAKEGLSLIREAEKFKNHHMAKGSTFVDWDKAFITWLYNANDFGTGSRPSRAPVRDPNKKSQRELLEGA